MRAAIQSESDRIGAKLVTNYSSDVDSIQFSENFGNDDQQGRLWTQSPDPAHFDALRRSIKKDADFDSETGLWVKRSSRAQFERYKAAKQEALANLVTANRKYAREVLGAKIEDPDDNVT
ncbi:MAG: hypothetical protein KDA80_18130 [Planctomycetaceae bacterium]|nr:hypothetical protein [Planctomycetaceae bacterium]